MLSEKVLALAERIKKAAPGKFYEQSVQNISYFNKDRTFMIRKKQSINKIKYYWLTDAQNKNITKRFHLLILLLFFVSVSLICFKN